MPYLSRANELTHLPRVLHICVSEQGIHYSGIGLSPVRRHPLPETMLANCHLDSWEQISMNIESKLLHFYLGKLSNCRLPKWRSFFPERDEWIVYPERGNCRAQSHKSHNAPIPYPTMHHLVQDFVHFVRNGELWDTGLGHLHCGIYEFGLLLGMWRCLTHNALRQHQPVPH